ncbi:MAG: alpha/beta fold hydrolase [Lysobacterales bacterium]
MTINRHFVRLDEGLVHYREAGHRHGGPPLLMMHASPASSAFLEPLMAVLGQSRRVIAPDTLGNGDSAPPSQASPVLGDYADSMDRFLTALNIEQCDVYGTHTGSHIGVELALQSPQRVRHLAMHGVAVLSAEEQTEFLTHYAPPQAPDDIGGQFNWAFHYVRDQMIFYPHFRKNPEHIRFGGHLEPEFLHTLAVGLLKNLTHYHKTYHAVFRHPLLERLAAVSVPVCLVTHEHDPLKDATALVEAECRNVEIIDLPSAMPVDEAAALQRWFVES